MALNDSYQQLLTQADELLKANQPADALAIFLRVAGRLDKLSAEMLAKRTDLRDLLIMVIGRANTIARTIDDFDSALKILEAGAQGLPELTPYRMFLRAQTLADAGRSEEAMQQLMETAQDPETPNRNRLDLAVEALWQRRPEDALRLLDALQEDAEDYAELKPDHWYLRFRTLSRLQRYAEAAQAWQTAKEASSEPLGTQEIVEMFIEMGDLDQALTFADSESLPASRGYLRGLVAELKGKHPWALDEWWRVVRDAFDVKAGDYMDWMEAAMRQDDLEKAETAIKAGIEEYPASPRLGLYAGLLSIKQGKLDEARAALRYVRVAHEQSRRRRTPFVYPSDRWLVEQSLSDPALRAEALEILFGESFAPPADEPTAAEA